MAIKEKIQKGDIDQKIPSPSEVAKLADKSPKKFTEAEINKIKQLQAEMNQTIISLGRLTISKKQLKEQEIALEKRLGILEKQEADLAKEFSDKYGKGSLDIETGEFTPIN